MQKLDTTWKIFGMYMLVILFMCICSSAKGQIQLAVFNAGWNEANKVDWAYELTDIQTASYIDVSKDTELQKKHKIAVIPTIIIFKDNIEVARFQADLSFKMVATKEQVQEEIDNQLMSDF
tara:strand:- start:140 stop:502 length:363 start_codon:yes stop_codon:yes gene_type:complete